ncbi:MAG: butyryl-CoA:acetate CoA-transferase [Desulfovibrio sp.]|nr:butyryl-CoA:acetate CoA-transferase [Desulfovibrio sp.]
MSYAEMYGEKLTTPEKAVAAVKSGDWVDYGFCVSQTKALDAALAARKGELEDVKVRGCVELWTPEIMKIPPAGNPFTWNTLHMTGATRKLTANGNCFYIPMRFSEVPRYYRENYAPVDVAMIQVSPMDKHGWFSFGPSASYLAAMCERAECIILEVNRNMPRCLGGHEAFIHITRADMIVEADSALGEMPASKPSEVDRAVAALVVDEIPDRACLQLGIGGLPNAVGMLLTETDLKDLSVHTEMYVDAFVDLTQCGKVTGAYKTVDRYRQCYAFAAGSKRMYEFLDDNPQLMSAPVDYVNDIRVLASIDNFISINNTVEVDLFGQLASESSGYRHISGAGGQLDFVLGAYLSRGGKSFICCSSTVSGKDGAQSSRIVPVLKPGAVVTATRANAHWLVTEYGKVNLKGLSTWEKAERIISAAHPDFRESLIKEAEKMNIWRRVNKK